MNITLTDPPRTFETGSSRTVTLRHCANIALESDELVSFVSEEGVEYDVVRKEWGFYATPSMNKRLKSFGLLPVLAENNEGHVFLLLVESGRQRSFEDYLRDQGMSVIARLDSPRALEALRRAMPGGKPSET